MPAMLPSALFVLPSSARRHKRFLESGGTVEVENRHDATSMQLTRKATRTGKGKVGSTVQGTNLGPSVHCPGFRRNIAAHAIVTVPACTRAYFFPVGTLCHPLRTEVVPRGPHLPPTAKERFPCRKPKDSAVDLFCDGFFFPALLRAENLRFTNWSGFVSAVSFVVEIAGNGGAKAVARGDRARVTTRFV